jgi:hypothetical protein
MKQRRSPLLSSTARCRAKVQETYLGTVEKKSDMASRAGTSRALVVVE